MRNAIVYDADDIRTLLAEKHGVEPKAVIRNQYSYTVVIGPMTEKTEEGGERV